jgi:hypothetical protein
VPAPNSGFVAVAAGGLHSLGLKADGSIVVWGYNLWGQINVPAPNSGFVAVAAGGVHSLGIQVLPLSIASANPPAFSPYGSGVFRDVLQNTDATLAPQGIGVVGTPSEGLYYYATISVTFSDPPSPVPAADNIAVSCTTAAGPSVCPSVASVSGSGLGPYMIALSGPPPPRECITLTFAGTNPGQKLQYQVLPGDTNLDGIVNTQDLLFPVQSLNNGSANLPANFARFNINRSQEPSNRVNTQDLLRLVQLLNGTNATQAFNGATVAACP